MKKDLVEAAVCNNMGLLRRNNEDNFCLNGRCMPLHAMDMGGLFACEGRGFQIYAVCDGMGGGDRGEESAFEVANALCEAARTGSMRSVKALDALLQRTSDGIYRKHETFSGSTVALLILAGERAVIMNVGDSRIYCLRNGMFDQVSLDHVGYQAHSITQYLGMPEEETLAPYYRIEDRLQWARDDQGDAVFLLCSDGLTDMVADEDIKAVLLAERRPRVAAQKLVDMALRHGGRDNVTAMVVRVPKYVPASEAASGADRWLTALQVASGIGAAYTLVELILRMAGN